MPLAILSAWQVGQFPFGRALRKDNTASTPQVRARISTAANDANASALARLVRFFMALFSHKNLEYSTYTRESREGL